MGMTDDGQVDLGKDHRGTVGNFYHPRPADERFARARIFANDVEAVKEIFVRQNKKLKEAPRAIKKQSLPDFLDAYGSQQLGESWPAVLSALNQKAKTYLRVNTLKTSPRRICKLSCKRKVSIPRLLTEFLAL